MYEDVELPEMGLPLPPAPTLSHRVSSAEESYGMPFVDSDPENEPFDDDEVVEGGELSGHGHDYEDGSSVATGDVSGYMDQPSVGTSVYPVLNYENSSVIMDPRKDMMVVAEGPVDEDMQRAWLATLEDGNGDGKSALEREQRAGWYDSNATMPAKVRILSYCVLWCMALCD
jgi:hypothetical protein